YNSVNYGPTSFITPASQPKTSSLAGQRDQSVFSARQSRLWFKVAGPTLLGAKTSSLIEFDFHDPNNTSTTSGNLNATPRLRHAYANLDWGTTQLLFGQTSDNFGILSGNTVDFNAGGPEGFFSGSRNPQIRLTQRVALGAGNSLKFVVAAQTPNQDNFTNSGATGAAGGTGDTWGSLPNAVGQILFTSKALGVSPGQYGFSLKEFTAGFFGLYGAQNIQGQAKLLDSWGAGFYTFVPVLKSKDGKSRANTLTIEAQTYVAANIPTATATSSVGKITTANPNGLNPAKGYGIASNIIYYPTQDWSFSVGYGQRGVLNNDDYVNNTNYEIRNELFWFNTFYDLNAAVRVAAEYQYLRTSYGNVKNNTTAGSALAGLADTGQANIGRFALYYFF
ncbi:MAG TPA: hypothetical protein VIU40_02010, partial [Geobacteraceae bacterium]